MNHLQSLVLAMILLVGSVSAVASQPMDGLPASIAPESSQWLLLARCAGMYSAIEEINTEIGRVGLGVQYKLQKEAVDSVLSLASAAQPTNPLVPSDNEIQTERLSGYIASRIYLDELVREDATYASIEFIEKHESKWDASLGVCRALLMSLPTS